MVMTLFCRPFSTAQAAISLMLPLQLEQTKMFFLATSDKQSVPPQILQYGIDFRNTI